MTTLIESMDLFLSNELVEPCDDYEHAAWTYLHVMQEIHESALTGHPTHNAEQARIALDEAVKIFCSKENIAYLRCVNVFEQRIYSMVPEDYEDFKDGLITAKELVNRTITACYASY